MGGDRNDHNNYELSEYGANFMNLFYNTLFINSQVHRNTPETFKAPLIMGNYKISVVDGDSTYVYYKQLHKDDVSTVHDLNKEDGVLIAHHRFRTPEDDLIRLNNIVVFDDRKLAKKA
jgi:hypothetical protein